MSSENPQMAEGEPQDIHRQIDALTASLEGNVNEVTQQVVASPQVDPFASYDHPIPTQFEAGMRRYGLDPNIAPKLDAQGEAMQAFLERNENESMKATGASQIIEQDFPVPPQGEIASMSAQEATVSPEISPQEVSASESIPVTPKENRALDALDQHPDEGVTIKQEQKQTDPLAEFGPIAQSSQTDPFAEFGPAVSSEKVEVVPSTLLDRLMEEMDAERTQHEKQKGKVLASAAKFLTRPFGMLARLGRATSDSVYKNFYRGYKNTIAVGEGIVEKAEGVVASGQKLMNKTLEAVRTTREEMREKKNNIKRQWILRKLQSLEMEQKQKKDEMAKEETEARNVAEQLLSQIQAQVKRADEIRVARENLNKPISVDSIEPL